MNSRVSKKSIFIVTGFIQAFFGVFEEFLINVSVSTILCTLLAYFFFKNKKDILIVTVISTAMIDIEYLSHGPRYGELYVGVS